MTGGQRILFPEWRHANETTKYPFSSVATLTNGQQFLVEGTFLDAALYPVGGAAGMFLAGVTVAHDVVTFSIGDSSGDIIATGTSQTADPADTVALYDSFGRPAGVLISESPRLGIFIAWGIGTFSFTAAQTEFAATVCFPVPGVGVRGIQLDDGTLLNGEAWLIGDDGVVLRTDTYTPPQGCQGTQPIQTIRVDVVGDPLFRRRLCDPISLFQTPRVIKEIAFVDAAQTVVCTPDAYGDIKILVNNDLAQDTVLRVRATADGNVIETVGSAL